MNAISEFLYGILDSINGIVNNYGIAIIIFTFLMRLVCMPFDYKSRKGMRKMTLIQPKLNELQRKYGNDKQKMQQKQAELMKKEGYNPLSGCLPMLLTWPLMIAMFSAMRNIANEQLIMQTFRYLAGEEMVIQPDEVFLWVKNIWMVDSPFAPSVPDLNSLKMVPREMWIKAYELLKSDTQLFSAVEATLAANNVVLDFTSNNTLTASIEAIMTVLGQNNAYVSAVQAVPGWQNLNFFLFRITVFENFNGLLILPILAGVTQVLQTMFMNPQQQQQPAAQGQQGTGNFMKWFFPLLSVYFCLSSNAAFALYWVMSSIVSALQSIVINKMLEKQDEKNANAQISGKGTIK